MAGVKPKFFVTKTCNTNWPKIKTVLVYGQTQKDCTDIVDQAFKLKKDKLMSDLKSGIFGQVVAYMWVIEFQK